LRQFVRAGRANINDDSKKQGQRAHDFPSKWRLAQG
jgi:hypothetical protein